jgi:hypothetical protein
LVHGPSVTGALKVAIEGENIVAATESGPQIGLREKLTSNLVSFLIYLETQRKKA